MQNNLKKHQNIVRMCAWTRKLEIDGQWVSVEEYLQRRFGLLVSHGICEDVLKNFHSDLSKAAR